MKKSGKPYKLFCSIVCLACTLLFTSHQQACAEKTSGVSGLFVTAYGIDQGLKQSMISQVLQDSRGLIWMVTGDGLQCFDGMRFRSFKVPYSGTAGGSESIMREIVENKPGEFLISTNSSILNFNTSNGIFKSVIRKPGYCPRILKISFKKNPLIWLPDKKLCCIKGEQIIRLRLNYRDKMEPPADFFPEEAVETASGDLLVYNDKGFLIIENFRKNRTGEFLSRWHGMRDGCQGLANGKDGKTYILSGKNIYTFLPSGRLELFSETVRVRDGKMFIDRYGNFWISDKGKKSVYRMAGKHTSEIRLITRQGKHTDTIQSPVIGFFEDKQGNLWLGTDGDGVLVYSPGKMQFNLAKTGFTRTIESRNGQLWAGTYRNGLWKLSEDFSKVSRLAHTALPANLYYFDLAFDRQSRLWAVTDQGLFVIDTLGNLAYRHPFTSNAATFLFVTPDTVALDAECQLYLYAPKDKPRLLDSKEFGNIRKFIQAAECYWLATPFGLYRSKASAGFFRQMIFIKKNRISLKPVNDILYLDNCIWSATETGIDRFDIRGRRLPELKALAELQNEVIYSLVPDALNRIWFTGNRGIGCIPQERNSIIWFNARNNLQSLEFNGQASHKTTDGRIFFGGINGLNGFDPAGFRPQMRAPGVRLISLFVADTAYSGGIPPENPEIRLSWQSPHISGRVFTDDYENPEMQSFSFLLEGYQKEWGNMSVNPEFVYRNLPPGHYRLFVKCSNAYRNQSKATCLLTLTITPPFWRTRWFLILSAVLTIFVTILIVKGFQDRRFKNRLHDLEKQNAVNKERLRIAKDMHDEIGASLTRISILSELAKSRQAEADQSMKIIGQISEISGNVVDEMSEIIWAMNPKNDTLDCFSSHLRQYASGYLETAGIDGLFNFPAEIPPAPMTSESRRNSFLTVKEALHNIVKHAGATTVRLNLSYAENTLSIGIADNGKGFDPGNRLGTGNGLVNMQKRILEIGGAYTLVSEPGKGTEIRFTVKLDPASE